MDPTDDAAEQTPTTSSSQVSLNKVMGRTIGRKNKEQRQFSNEEMSENIAKFNAMRSSRETYDDTELDPSIIALKREQRLQAYKRSKTSPGFSVLAQYDATSVAAPSYQDNARVDSVPHPMKQMFDPKLPSLPLPSPSPPADFLTSDALMQPEESRCSPDRRDDSLVLSSAAQTTYASLAPWNGSPNVPRS
ncbi:hypothetical protein PENSPDRAFT_659030 [Peniophora sp. CONT]|nr:hypothetical protein PENSPDRAFT_659030 [Peniophora sp. CONT]